MLNATRWAGALLLMFSGFTPLSGSRAVAENSTSAPVAGVSLSNGLRAGMTPDQVAQTLKTIPDIEDARVTGSKKNPTIMIKYMKEYSDLDGFEFRFSFNFEGSRLFWVDLESRPMCSHNTSALKQDLRSKFAKLYDASDISEVFHKSGTDIYIFEKSIPIPAAIYSGGSEVAFKLAQLEIRNMLMIDEKCGYGNSLATVIVRFREGQKAAIPLTNAEVLRNAAEIVRLREASDAKAKSDRDRLSLPQ